MDCFLSVTINAKAGTAPTRNTAVMNLTVVPNDQVTI